MSALRVALASIVLAVLLVVTQPPAAEAASARCRYGTVHCVRPVPWICRYQLIKILFPNYCARVLI